VERSCTPFAGITRIRFSGCVLSLDDEAPRLAKATIVRSAQNKEEPMSSEDNKDLVRRFYAELDKLNVGVIDELVAEDFVNHAPPPFPVPEGREGLKHAFEIFARATPGEHEILDQVAEGDKVVTRLRAVGTHEDDLPGIPRTGNKMDVTATVVHRIEDGKIAEKWSDRDELALLQQLGVVSLPGPDGP
jgi:predicted ester cyclase